MNRIALTGANGFVGRQVLACLLAQGHAVRCIVRSAESPGLREEGKVEWVTTPDLFAATPDELARLVSGCDTCLHCAWYAEPGRYLESPLNLECLAGTLRLALACAEQGVQRWVGIGTCFEYDVTQRILDTQTPLKPATLYAACKAGAYQVLQHMMPARGVSFLWCRLFYLYGPGEDPRRFVPYLHHKLAVGEPAELTSGKQVRDYLDVQEAAALIVEAAGGREEGPINICSGVPVTVREMAERIADEYGRRDLLRFGVRPENLFDPPCIVGRRI